MPQTLGMQRARGRLGAGVDMTTEIGAPDRQRIFWKRRARGRQEGPLSTEEDRCWLQPGVTRTKTLVGKALLGLRVPPCNQSMEATRRAPPLRHMVESSIG